ncbi:PA14 domain protein [Fusarium austroafricanum]|uniref:PA14 domain protein n=1 Tax=Fusarium austroafricanum TaxID=2364996 RepID=A0A8H4KIX1_9HYPO|nr:PA14 domain protein [Fusarium austroafricanum]
MKRIVIKYIELLVAAGDVFFRQMSRESLPLALQKYIEASHVIGKAPVRINSLAKRPGRSYNRLSKDLDSFSNITLNMELEFPYSSLQRGHGLSKEVEEAPAVYGLPGLLSTTYFCVPQNPDLVELRALIDDRLAKIRNNQDINGQTSPLPLFDPPIDPAAMVQAYGAAAAGGGPVTVALKELTQSLGEYRFSVLLQKAYEINNELRIMSELFLSAKEKDDSEGLSNLRAQQEMAIANLTLASRNLQKEEATKTLEILKDNRKSAEARLKFYLALTGESTKALPGFGTEWSDIQYNISEPTKDDDLKMSPEEKMEFEKAEEASDLGWKATILDTTASALMAIPNTTTNAQPMGMGLSLKIDAENVAKCLMGTSTVLQLKSQLASEEGSRASRKSQLKKQLQERKLMANTVGRELVNLDKQIAAQDIRISMSNSDIKTQEASLQHAESTEAWLKSKYTNQQLYTWLESSARMLNFEIYSLAIDLARKAERALRFEQGNFSSSSIIDPRGYWNSSQNGLMTAQSLQLALKKLELSSMEQNPNELEISKTVSLRQLSPASLLRLRAEGSTQFSLPEIMYDLDFPGHYFRRIRSVALSIPCITGPYTGVNATLSLLEHKCRVSSIAGKGDYKDTGRDDRFQTQKYMPFEKAGAISTWKLELPPVDLAQFDYSTISDVILHIKYTARQGGQGLRDAVTAAVRDFRQSVEGLEDTEGLFAFIDLTNECSDEWRAAVRNPTNADSTELLLKDAREFLPFWAQGRTVNINTAMLALRTGEEDGLPILKHPGLKVEVVSGTKTKWKEMTTGGLFRPTIDKNESARWAIFNSKRED